MSDVEGSSRPAWLEVLGGECETCKADAFEAAVEAADIVAALAAAVDEYDDLIDAGNDDAAAKAWEHAVDALIARAVSWQAANHENAVESGSQQSAPRDAQTPGELADNPRRLTT